MLFSLSDSNNKPCREEWVASHLPGALVCSHEALLQLGQVQEERFGEVV